jgi:hypothetical protein
MVGDLSHPRQVQHRFNVSKTCPASTIYIAPNNSFLNFTTHSPIQTTLTTPPMPRSKKPTPKQRKTPYPTPATPANPNPRSTPTGSFPPPPLGFPSTFPNPAYPQYSLTPFEQGQTLHDYCRDLQNGIQRSPNVDEDGNAGPTGVPSLERDDEGTPGVPKVGEGSEIRREGRLEQTIGDGGVDKRGIAPKTPDLSKRKGDRETVYPLSNKSQQRPSTGCPEDPPFIDHPHPPQQYPDSPREPPPSDLAHPPPLTEEEIWLSVFKPVEKFNARTPWPKTSHEPLLTPPDWHADCPEGYEPSTLAGYPQRQYPACILAAHDAGILREEYGHYCLDLDEWDRCCMGKCGGCEICRPHM